MGRIKVGVSGFGFGGRFFIIVVRSFFDFVFIGRGFRGLGV